MKYGMLVCYSSATAVWASTGYVVLHYQVHMRHTKYRY